MGKGVELEIIQLRDSFEAAKGMRRVLTQGEFAKKIGTSKATYFRMLAGEAEIEQTHLLKAKELGDETAIISGHPVSLTWQDQLRSLSRKQIGEALLVLAEVANKKLSETDPEANEELGKKAVSAIQKRLKTDSKSKTGKSGKGLKES